MDSHFEYLAEQGIFHGNACPLMGTKLDLLTVGADRQTVQEVWDRICAKGAQLEKMLSGNDPSGELGRFHAGRRLAHSPISEELCHILETALDYRLPTCCLYDVTLGKSGLVDLNTENCTLSLYGATLDFGGFRKGWLLEYCRQELLSAGVGTAFVDFGSSVILGIGKHPYGDAWKVSLTNPFSRIPLSEVSLCDRALSISANGPGFTGRIIDPKTGLPCDRRRLTAVTSPDPVEAKVLSTALMLASDDEVERMKSRFPNATLYCFDLS